MQVKYIHTTRKIHPYICRRGKLPINLRTIHICVFGYWAPTTKLVTTHGPKATFRRRCYDLRLSGFEHSLGCTQHFARMHFLMTREHDRLATGKVFFEALQCTAYLDRRSRWGCALVFVDKRHHERLADRRTGEPRRKSEQRIIRLHRAHDDVPASSPTPALRRC